MEDQSRNVDRRRILYKPIDIVSEGCKTVGEDGESLHNLCGIYLGMLTEVVWRRSLLWPCRNVGLWMQRSVELVNMLNVNLIA